MIYNDNDITLFHNNNRLHMTFFEEKKTKKTEIHVNNNNNKAYSESMN